MVVSALFFNHPFKKKQQTTALKFVCKSSLRIMDSLHGKKIRRQMYYIQVVEWRHLPDGWLEWRSRPLQCSSSERDTWRSALPARQTHSTSRTDTRYSSLSRCSGSPESTIPWGRGKSCSPRCPPGNNAPSGMGRAPPLEHLWNYG